MMPLLCAAARPFMIAQRHRRLCDSQPSSAVNPVFQVLAEQALHHEIRGRAVDEPCVEHLDDPAVTHRPECSCLTEKSQRSVVSVFVARVKHLERYGSSQEEMLGLVDDAHPADAKNRQQLVFAVDSLPEALTRRVQHVGMRLAANVHRREFTMNSPF